MSNVWFTSDTHFGHANIIKYCDRPFENVDVMDEALIDYWNMNVKDGDIVYHLGDFCFGLADKYVKHLNGSIILIKGSHDDRTVNQYRSLFKHIHEFGHELKIDGLSITLCHYCLKTWPKSHYNTYHLFGHSHGNLKTIGKLWDVGVDNNSFRPISIDEVKVIMNNLPDNFNYINRSNG
jgi:calcineurin-like phosphoesterase family protein